MLWRVKWIPVIANNQLVASLDQVFRGGPCNEVTFKLMFRSCHRKRWGEGT